MPDPYYRRISGDDLHGRYAASVHTVGPWSPLAQHGGPPNALAVLLAERAVRDASGRLDLYPLRIAAEFVGAVPVGEFDVLVSVERIARSAALCGVAVVAGGRTCLTARVWFVRDADTTAVATAARAPATPPPVDPATGPPAADWDFGYGRSITWAFERGGPPARGPSSVWTRAHHDVLDEGDGLPGLARAVLVADSASGVSAELDWAQWSFANVDLDVHLLRPLVGDWVHLEATTLIGPTGAALARSTIADVDGVVGAGAQTLVVAPLRGRAGSGP